MPNNQPINQYFFKLKILLLLVKLNLNFQIGNVRSISVWWMIIIFFYWSIYFLHSLFPPPNTTHGLIENKCKIVIYGINQKSVWIDSIEEKTIFRCSFANNWFEFYLKSQVISQAKPSSNFFPPDLVKTFWHSAIHFNLNEPDRKPVDSLPTRSLGKLVWFF